MAHIAILTIGGHGHVNPTIDLVAEAVSRGHRVSYCAPAGFGWAAQAAGAQLVTYESLLTPRPAASSDRRAAAAPAPTAAEFAAYLPFILVAETNQVLPQLMQAFAGDVPDVLVYDRTAYATGRVLGEKWGRPTVETFVSFAYNEHFSLAAVTKQQSVLDPNHEAYQALADQLAALATNNHTSTLTVDDPVRDSWATSRCALPVSARPFAADKNRRVRSPTGRPRRS